MRKLVAMVTLSTVVGLGAVATVTGTASALEPDVRIEQATVERQDAPFVMQDRDRGTDPRALLEALMESVPFEVNDDQLHLLAEAGVPRSVHDMFEMAMLMNHLSQVFDTASSVASANAAISDMARGIKG